MLRRNIIRSMAIGLLSPRFFFKPVKKKRPADTGEADSDSGTGEAGSKIRYFEPGNANPNEVLFFNNPGQYWNSQALHIGNGYLGLSFLGGLREEIFSITEKSLWTGGPGENKDYYYGIKKGGKEYLPAIRELILSNQPDKIKEADKLVRAHFWGDEAGYGHFSAFGRLSVLFDHPSAADFKNYTRSLDLSESIARVQYEIGGVQYRREYFCSYPDRVAVMRFSAATSSEHSAAQPAPGSGKFAPNSASSAPDTKKNPLLSFRLRWNVFQKDHSIVFKDNQLQLSGTINGNQRKFCLKMQLFCPQGDVFMQGDELIIRDAGPVTILLSAATEYRPAPPSYQGADPYAITGDQISRAGNKTFDQLKHRHTGDYQRLYNRIRLDVPSGKTTTSIATDTRWKNYKEGKNPDAGLKVLYFNLGRYLLISSSRPGSLPANLQGGWNMVEAAPWSGNYQSNINVQLNYSGACATGLSECLDPYIDWIKGLVIPGRAVAKEYYGSTGWVSHPIGNIWGYAAPGFGAEWGMYPAGAAWHCHFVWKKFAYTRDLKYLEETGYPILKEASDFWLQNLVEYQGWLVSAPSGSAEHGAYIESGKLVASGSSYGADMINIPGNFQDIEMIRELFTNTIEAAALLKTDPAFAQKIKAARNRLMPLKTGQRGQLQEWAEDIDSPECNHRHIAHLYSIWPAKQIAAYGDGAGLLNAVKKTLEWRGEARNYKNLPHKDIFTAANWSLGLRMICWIRLQDAKKANSIFTQLITDAGFENLLTFQQTPMQFSPSLKDQPDMYYLKTDEGYWNPVWQIDASLAIPGFITEMLLQAYPDDLFLLPCLPEEWPDGKIKGLRAEGNLIVDIEWKDRQVTSFNIVSATPVPSNATTPASRTINVHYNGERKEVSF